MTSKISNSSKKYIKNRYCFLEKLNRHRFRFLLKMLKNERKRQFSSNDALEDSLF